MSDDDVDALGPPKRIDDPPERDETHAPPGTMDAHVHLFPQPVCEAIRRRFDENAWAIRYRQDAESVDAFLTARGVERYPALCYWHVEGMAESLNRFVLQFARTHPRCIPCATALPGEPGARGRRPPAAPRRLNSRGVVHVSGSAPLVGSTAARA